jgi:hypothetical protein
MTQKIWALSFGGGTVDYRGAVNRIGNEFSRTGFFDKVITFTDIDLKNDTEFWEKHGAFIKSHRRGYGYWLWKPYLMKKTFEQMSENDILFYLDSGCEMKSGSNDTLKEYVKRCDECNILYTSTRRNEKTWTKMDLFRELDMNNDKIKNSTQHQAGVTITKKTTLTTDFLNDWYSIACNYHLIDDSPSVYPNDPSFQEHRHDQSIFSLLIKSEKYKDTMNTKDNLLDRPCDPILISRKRHG